MTLEEKDTVALVACFSQKQGRRDLREGTFHLAEGDKTACGLLLPIRAEEHRSDHMWFFGMGQKGMITCPQCLLLARGPHPSVRFTLSQERSGEDLGGIVGLFPIFPHAPYTRVQLPPFQYPDGEIVDLFVTRTETRLTMTDLGETLRWIRTNDRSLALQYHDEVLPRYGVEYARGQLSAQVMQDEEPCHALLRLAQVVVLLATLSKKERTKRRK